MRGKLEQLEAKVRELEGRERTAQSRAQASAADAEARAETSRAAEERLRDVEERLSIAEQAAAQAQQRAKELESKTLSSAHFPSDAVVRTDGVLNVPFYWYEDTTIRMTSLAKLCPTWGKRDADVTFIEQAKSHPMRTKSIAEAKLFLVTIPLVTSFGCGKKYNHTERATAALRKLVASEAWVATRGRNHIWMLFDWRIMRWADSAWNMIPDDPGRGEWEDHLRLIANMTVLTYENWHSHPASCAAYSKTFNNYCHPPDFSWLPFETWACSVVVPYFAGEGLSDKEIADVFPKSTFAEWQKRSTVLFYRNDPRKDYHWGATPVRRAPGNLSGLPNVSVGGHVSKSKHLSGLASSKFCLVTRGDTPSSHKVYDALRALCVPVIVSDQWHRVAKPFPTLLSWDAFSISIPEGLFMKDPKQAVAFLWTLSTGELRRLHGALLSARQALDWRAPSSKTTSFALASAAETCLQPL